MVAFLPEVPGALAHGLVTRARENILKNSFYIEREERKIHTNNTNFAVSISKKNVETLSLCVY